MPKNVLVFGGTGGVGQHIVQKMAEGDWRSSKQDEDPSVMYVVTRKPDNYEGFKNDNVKVIACNIFDADSIKKTIEEHQISLVFCVLGFEPKDGQEYPPGYERNMKATVEAMKQTSCKRLIYLSTWFSKPETRECSKMGCMLACTLCCMMPFLARIFTGHWKATEYLEANADGIDYTVCRAPILEMGPAGPNKQGFNTAENEFYVPATNYWKGSREDAARFLIKVADDDSFKRQTVAFGRENSCWCCCMV